MLSNSFALWREASFCATGKQPKACKTALTKSHPRLLLRARLKANGAASNLCVLIASFALVANAGDHDPVQGIVPRIARQIAAASAGDDEFTQTTFHRATNAGLMRQHLQCIQDEIEQFPSQWVIGLVQKRFKAHQILKCRLA